MLLIIQAVLEDAEEKQTTSKHVEIWLSELRDLVYNVEDVFATEGLRQESKEKHKAAAGGSTSNKVSNFLPALFIAGLKPTSVAKFNVEMGSKLKKITARLEIICTWKSNLDLGERAGGRGGGSSLMTRETTSLPDSHIFGRDKDKQAILDLLLTPAATVAGGSRVYVIPIQGMGWVGKTTLAQVVYNDPKVKDSFDLKAWVCVSATFHILSITRTTLQSISGGGTYDGMTLDQLQVKLEKILSGKKFLIVLDDVWNEK